MNLQHGVSNLQSTVSISTNTPNTQDISHTLSCADDATSPNPTPNDIDTGTQVIQMPETIELDVTEQEMSEKRSDQIRHIFIPVVLGLNIVIFADAYYIAEDVNKDLLKTTLSVAGVHFMIGRALEHHIHSLKPEHKIFYSTTACIRDVINNIAMTLFYILDDYAYWWKPMMWGCYMTDLVMLISKWHYFKPGWLRFVFAHHFGVALMLLILNHTTKILTPPACVCLILFMNSNTPGCVSPIWKAFKLPFYERSSVICFLLQRAVRLAAYGAALNVDPQHFFKKDYDYIVLVSFALVLDIWDIKSQLSSIYRYHRKQKLEAVRHLNSNVPR